MEKKKIRLGYSEKTVPVYTQEEILDAIRREGLSDDAWGYKGVGYVCIWVYRDAQENDDVWRNIHPSLTGIESAFYDGRKLEKVNYYILDTYK